MSIYNVELKKIVDDSYQIEIGFDLIDKLCLDIKKGLVKNFSKIALITDSNVEKLYAEKINKKLNDEGFVCNIFSFEAGEKSKTRKTKEEIEDRMLNCDYRRDSLIIAVGGGVVTDIAGFIAGTFARGIPFINYATTLLAAADASVGGKTAVDTPRATNLIGLFNQPKKVYIDIASWKTLPKEHIYNGLSETIKQACLADKNFFEYLDDNMDKILDCQKEVCQHMAEENCKIKDSVVMKDEKEAGLREVLNLGHTVGRAVETVSNYELLHGEAVSIGLSFEVKLSNKLGFMTDEECLKVINLLKKAHLPVKIPEYIDKESLVKKLYTDKKVRNGKLRFVIQRGIGEIVEFEKGNYATVIDEDTVRNIIIKM
ncbi:3-dehydroquinate synthase [Clostridium sp. BJN0001]|uniref:3-dehydroquinate synthase n=1 Tax=Clostridium sp. BJN0001 TaxID=2930219 RepID=UPI001FCFF11B|nr:3-dehydroquinate synthase [Clostridium sp. BJN0001]